LMAKHLHKCPERSETKKAGFMKIGNLPKRNPEDTIMRLRMWGCVTPIPAIPKETPKDLVTEETSCCDTAIEVTPQKVKPTPKREEQRPTETVGRITRKPSKAWKSKTKTKSIKLSKSQRKKQKP